MLNFKSPLLKNSLFEFFPPLEIILSKRINAKLLLVMLEC